MSNPYMDQSMAKVIEVMLNPYLRDGENCAMALERLLRELDLARYDAGRNTHAVDEERALRRMFYAACLSQPENTLRIKLSAVADVSGTPGDHELVIVEDPTTHESVCRVQRRR